MNRTRIQAADYPRKCRISLGMSNLEANAEIKVHPSQQMCMTLALMIQSEGMKQWWQTSNHPSVGCMHRKAQWLTYQPQNPETVKHHSNSKGEISDYASNITRKFDDQKN